MDKITLLEKIDRIVDEMSGSLPDAESSHGWTEESRVALLKSFRDLRSRLANDELLKADITLNFPRGMDMWGIFGGNWFSQGAEITRDLHQYMEG